MTQAEVQAASSGRKWTAWILLAVVLIWVLVKAVDIFQAMSSGSGFAMAQAVDFTNPSRLSIIGVGSIIAYFFVRPKGTTAGTVESEDAVAPAEYAPAVKTTCDQCGESFPSGYYLVKSEGNRYLCQTCRTGLKGA